jgi:flagellar protein FlaI
VSGTGKDIDFENHEDDKKTFYGLMKKKASLKESAPAEQAEKMPAETTSGETGVTGYYGIDSDMAPPKETGAVDAADERLSRIFQGAQTKSAAATEPQAAVKPAAEPEPVAESTSYMSNNADGISAEAIPASTADRTATPSGQETGNAIFPAGSLETEDDIMKELNSIVKPGDGVVRVDEEEKIEKSKGKKDKSKLRQKIVFEPYDPEKHGPMTTFPGVTGYEEVERYWVNEPYAFIVILYNESTNNYLYYVCEPSLTMFEKELLVEVYDRLQDVLMMENLDVTTDKKELLKDKVNQTINDYIGKIDTKSYYKIMYYINRDYLEFGKINPLMHDNFIEDISNNGFDTPVFLYHKNYENIMTNIVYAERQLDSYVIRLAQRCGKHISIAEPMVDATMPDGSRIQLTLGKEVTTRGSTFTIRKFKEVPITPIDLIAWNTFSSEEMSYLWLCIENNKSLLFSGGTASGKTSSLNAVSLFIPPKAKVISLEDTRELKLPHMNWIPGLTRDSFTADGKGAIEMFTLLKAALRQRPEYLLVGEVRGKEALTLFQAMSTGHTTFSTMHADSVESAIHRLENPPISVPRTMVTALDIISIQAQTYLKNKRVRRNMKIVEINDIDANTRNIRTNDIFVWNSSTDRFDRVGESRVLTEIAQRRAWSKRELSAELMRRQKVLEYLLNNNIREFKQIAAIIHAYAVKPDRVLEKLGIKE